MHIWQHSARVSCGGMHVCIYSSCFGFNEAKHLRGFVAANVTRHLGPGDTFERHLRTRSRVVDFFSFSFFLVWLHGQVSYSRQSIHPAADSSVRGSAFLLQCLWFSHTSHTLFALLSLNTPVQSHPPTVFTQPQSVQSHTPRHSPCRCQSSPTHHGTHPAAVSPARHGIHLAAVSPTHHGIHPATVSPVPHITVFTLPQSVPHVTVFTLPQSVPHITAFTHTAQDPRNDGADCLSLPLAVLCLREDSGNDLT